MKVCTDSCLFGAWVANLISQTNTAKNLLDIGTGTGLLSLMIAQKNPSFITSVEINKDSFIQAAENFSLSPWSDRLQAIEKDIKFFNPDKKFDYIISNPPFFENDLKSNHHSKNLARHQEGLSLKELIKVIGNLLKKEGRFALLVPYHRLEEVIELATDHSFYLQEKLLVKQTSRHLFFRGMLLFSREKANSPSSEITIKNTQGIYTKEFKSLLKDYYLK